jgi:hypothetical protein
METQNEEKESIQRMRTEKMTLRYAYDKSFMVRYPDGYEWKDGLETNKQGGLICHTDSSKTNKDTGAGMYGYGTW